MEPEVEERFQRIERSQDRSQALLEATDKKLDDLAEFITAFCQGTGVRLDAIEEWQARRAEERRQRQPSAAR